MIEKIKEALRKVEQKDVLSELTEIEINTENEEVYNACLEIRNQLIPDNHRQGDSLRWDILQAKDEPLREEDCDSERQEGATGTAGEHEKQKESKVKEDCEKCNGTGTYVFISHAPIEGETEYDSEDCECPEEK